MALRLNQELATRLIRPHLEPREELLYTGHGIEQPWWSHLVRIGAFFWKYYVVAGTSERLLLVRVGTTWKLKEVEAIAWRDVTHLELGRGLLMRPLVIEAPIFGRRRRINLPRFSPLRNLAAAEGIVETWRTARAGEHALP